MMKLSITKYVHEASWSTQQYEFQKNWKLD